MNAAVELTDRMVERGFGDHTALVGHGRRRTYKELADWSYRLARALIEDYGVRPGNRVLIRSANNPAMIACWLAATKAGAVSVNTMPMLRAGELAKIVDKAEIGLALCDTRILDEFVACAKDQPPPEASSASTAPPITTPSSTASPSTSHDLRATSRRDGQRRAARLHLRHHRPAKGHGHFHRDLLIIIDAYAGPVLHTRLTTSSSARAIAFTFRLGGSSCFR